MITETTTTECSAGIIGASGSLLHTLSAASGELTAVANCELSPNSELSSDFAT